MTPRAAFFSQTRGQTLQSFNTADLQLFPTYKMALWSPKRYIWQTYKYTQMHTHTFQKTEKSVPLMSVLDEFKMSFRW